MTVKRSQSLTRALRVIDAVAAGQPVSVSALARLVEEDRSAVQRTVMTLADAGWLRPAPGAKGWELSAHLFAIANLPRSDSELRRRARPALEALGEETGESAFLAIPDQQRFVVIDVVESRQPLRMVPRIGEAVAPENSSTGRAVLPWLPAESQAALLGRTPHADDEALFALTRARGYAASVGEVFAGATNLAAPVFDVAGRPIAAMAICGPSERLDEARIARFGPLLAERAGALSEAMPVQS